MNILEDLGFDWKSENSRVLKQISNTNNSSILQKKQAQGKKKGSWSLEEDCRLIKAHFWYGKDWVSVASLVGTRTNVQCTSRAKRLLPGHSYIGTPSSTWFCYDAVHGSIHGPFNNDAMCAWVMQGAPGDAPISLNSTGPFGPMGMFFADTSKAFLSTDEATDAVKERNMLIEEKAVKFWPN